MDAFGFEACVKVGKGLVKETGKQKKGWALVESLIQACQSGTASYQGKAAVTRTHPSWWISEQRPPVKSFFSSTVTLKPAFASRAAVATPPAPAPEMASSAHTRPHTWRDERARTHDNCRLLLIVLAHGCVEPTRILPQGNGSATISTIMVDVSSK